MFRSSSTSAIVAMNNLHLQCPWSSRGACFEKSVGKGDGGSGNLIAILKLVFQIYICLSPANGVSLGKDHAMEEFGMTNQNLRLDVQGFSDLAAVHYNLSEAELYEHAIRKGEAILTAHGALRALTGQHTGRSPKDKHIVRDDETEDQIWWDNNRPMSPEQFSLLMDDMLVHARGKALYVQDLIGGADQDNALPVRVVTAFAWHSLFIRNLLIRPKREDLSVFVPKLTIIDLPSFRADPARHGSRTETVIAVDLTRKIVLIGGTSYAGEMKKSVFTALNYLLPEQSVMPMHCSANEGPDGDAAVFFGLSGTGKTTLVGHLMATIDRERLLAIRIASTQIEPDDLLRMVANGLDLDPDGMTKSQLLSSTTSSVRRP
eukprot:gene37997-51314_t